jgi:hypothetical protein
MLQPFAIESQPYRGESTNMGKELAVLSFWALQASLLASDISGVDLNVIAACFCFHLLSPPFQHLSRNNII